MIGGVEVAKGSGGIVINNAQIQQYYANSGTIAPYTFVEFINGKIQESTTKIDGLTITSASTSSTGNVYVLGSGS